MDQGGLFDMADYKRYNIRSNIDVNLSDNLTVSLDISGRNDKTTNSIVDEWKLYQTLETAVPTIPAYVPEELREPGDELGLNYNGTAGSPMGEAIHSGYIKGENNYLESKFGFNYKIPFIEGLSAKVDFSYDERFTKEKKWNVPYTLNFYTQEAGLTSSVPSQSVVTLNQKIEERNNKTFQGGFNYGHSFGKHSVTGLLLFEQTEYRYDLLSGYREQFLGTSIEQLFAGSDVNKDNDGKAAEYARRSFVGRIAYNYNDKYLFQANGRSDGSHNFPKHKRWGFFQGYSVGWRISKESFMENIGFLDNLKLRVSYGQFGNDNINESFYYLPGYNISNGYLVSNIYYTGIMDTGIPNENITWETATTLNYGIDFGLFNGKISGEFDYFKKRTEGILIDRGAAVPLFVGAKLPKENIGVVDNWGYETILRYRDRKGKLSYEIEGNITYATSKVIKKAEAIGTDERLRETGRPFDSRYGYTALGLFQTQEEIDAAPVQDGNNNNSIHPGDIRYLDLNNDSIIDAYDRQYLGKGETPELIFGINMNVQYKNFSLNVNFQGASNYTRYLYLNSFEKNYNTYSVLENSWREGNEDAEFPRLEANGHSPNNSLYSSYWLKDGFYIKLRNIELSYSITDNPFLDKVGIEEVTISASGRNLWTIAKKDGFDPEGTDRRYPIMQTMSIGLNIIF